MNFESNLFKDFEKYYFKYVVKEPNDVLRGYAEKLLENEKEFLSDEEYENAIKEEIDNLSFNETQKILNSDNNNNNVFTIPLKKLERTNNYVNLLDF